MSFVVMLPCDSLDVHTLKCFLQNIASLGNKVDKYVLPLFVSRLEPLFEITLHEIISLKASFDISCVKSKPVFGFPTRSNTNRAVQLEVEI